MAQNIESRDQGVGFYWPVDFSGKAKSSRTPQSLRIFPREAKNIKHDFFLTASRGKILTKIHRTREKFAEQTGTQGGELSQIL